MLREQHLVVAVKPHRFSREDNYPHYVVLNATLQLRLLRGLVRTSHTYAEHIHRS